MNLQPITVVIKSNSNADIYSRILSDLQIPFSMELVRDEIRRYTITSLNLRSQILAEDIGNRLES